MIDHLTLTVRDLGRAKSFYTSTLAPLGYGLIMDFGEMLGFGEPHKPFFWIKQGAAPQSPMHLAFRAKSRAAVDGFHQAALAASATDDGAPGLRPDYHANYYGAFIIDPDGHHLEAVSHGDTAAPKKAAPKKKSAAKKSVAKKAVPKKASRKPVKKAAKQKRK